MERLSFYANGHPEDEGHPDAAAALDAVEDAGDRAEIERRAEQIAWNRMESVLHNIPPIVRNARLTTNCKTYADEPDKARALRAAEALRANGSIEHRGRTRYGLFLTGPYGTGKTWLATATFLALAWRYYRDWGVRYQLGERAASAEQRFFARANDAPGFCRWAKFHNFIREVQDCYHRTAERSVGDVLEGYQKTPVLLLDDVGDLDVAAESEDRKRLLYEVLDHRNDWGLPTVLTTNLSMKELEGQFGGRTVQRVLEMAALVEMGGSNLRVVALNGKANGGGEG